MRFLTPTCWHRPSPRVRHVRLHREVKCVLLVEQDIRKSSFTRKHPSVPLISLVVPELLGRGRGWNDDGGTVSPCKALLGPQRIEAKGKTAWKPFGFNDLRPSGV